jgi:hypothetical protein
MPHIRVELREKHSELLHDWNDNELTESHLSNTHRYFVVRVAHRRDRAYHFDLHRSLLYEHRSASGNKTSNATVIMFLRRKVWAVVYSEDLTIANRLEQQHKRTLATILIFNDREYGQMVMSGYRDTNRHSTVRSDD